MTFRTNKPMHEGVPQPGAMEFPRDAASASAPAFRPQIVRSVRMHPVLAAGVAAVVFAGLVGYALRQKMVYLASSQVYEEPASAKLLSTSADLFDANKYDTFLNEQMQLVQRLDVITAALATLPQADWREFGATKEQAADAIQALLKVQRIATSYQISISLKGSDAANTAAIVNAITTAYLGAVHKASAAETDQRASLLAEERERVEKELQAARTEQSALGASIGVASPTGETGNPYDAQLSGVRAQLTEARAAHDVAAAQLASLSGLGPSKVSGLTAAADELIGGDSGLSTMKSAISEKKAALTSQMAGMKPSNPIYQQDQEELADLDRTLDTATNELRAKTSRRLQDKLRSDLERTGDIEARLNGELSRQIASATSAAPKLQRAGEVAADLQRLNLREAAVDDALRGLRMDSNAPEQVRLSLAAPVPAHPEANRKKLLLVAALPLALLFGAGAAVFMRKQDNKIYSGLDIEEVLGFQPLAVLPARADVPERVFEEYVLRLAAGVESAYRTSGARTFLLTAVSLTTDIAPLATALTRKFEEIGVNAMVATASEMLTPSESAPEENRKRTPGELARVVELWSEGFVASNMARMKAEHGLVLIESQALLNCAQTEYVARCADATILAVECGVTTRQELFEAAELLQRLNVTGIGAVLEELQLRFADTAFRKAIDSLDRRQSAAVRKQVVRVPPIEVGPEVEYEAELRQEPEAANTEEPSQFMEARPVEYHEPVTEYEPVIEYHEPISLATEPVPLEYEPVAVPTPEPEVAAASLEPEPVVEEAAEPEEESDAVEEAVPALASRYEAVPAAAAGPVLVDTPPIASWAAAEDALSERMIAVANGSFREKISPAISVRRDETTSSGDARMTRNTSWLDRLLRRNADTVFRLVPDREESRTHRHADDVEDEEPDNAPEIAARAAKNREEYDLPLANRLDQISRSRQAFTPSPADAAPASGRTPRLQIVPHERPAPAPEALLTGLFPVVGVADEFGETPAPEIPSTPAAMPQLDPVAVEPAKEPETPVWQLPATEWKVEEQIPHRAVVWDAFAHAVEPAELAPEPVPSEAEPTLVPDAEPRFEEAVDEPLSPPVVQAAPETPVAAPVARPRRPLTFRELAGPAIAPVVVPEPPQVVVPEPASQASTLAEPVLREPEIVHEVPAELSRAEVELAAAPVDFEPVEAEPEPVAAQPVPEPAAEVATHLEVPGYPATTEPEPVRQADAETDDIEPVYREASRSLTSGRWDPIPPLRPSGSGWRDRPSPVPASNPAAISDRRRWTDDTPTPTNRMGSEPQPTPTESLSEPLLTRQWGLLSRFQQARISSARPAAEKPNEETPDVLPQQDRQS